MNNNEVNNLNGETSNNNNNNQEIEHLTEKSKPTSDSLSRIPTRSTIDEYLDKVGYSKFQIISIMIVCYLFFIDGCEMILINLILSSLQNEWNINTVQRSLLSSAVFFGFFTGSFFSGYFTNRFGRKNPCLFGCFVIWFFTSCTPLTYNFQMLFILRIFVGLGIGIMVPSVTSLITETIPSYYRSFVLNFLWILYPLGIIYICLISTYFIEKKEFLQWRNIAFMNSYTSMSMIFLVFYLNESPRYLLFKEKYEEAFTVLDNIGKSRKIRLSEEEKEKIKIESINLNAILNEKSNFNVKIFFNEKYLKTTILLSYIWFMSSLILYGLLYILPKIFDGMSKHDKLNSLHHMIEAMIILFPCPLIRGILSEMKILGRKKSMLIGFAGASFVGVMCLMSQKNLSIYAGLLKFFISISLGIVSVYTSEIYPTNIRSVSLGFGNSITRLAGILTPFICEAVEMYVYRGSFWVFIIVAVTGVIISNILPYETMDMALDSLAEENKEKEMNKGPNFKNFLEEIDKENCV